MKHLTLKLLQQKRKSPLRHNHWLVRDSIAGRKIQPDYRQVFLLLIEFAERMVFHLLILMDFSKPIQNSWFRTYWIQIISFFFRNFTLIFQTFEETYDSFFHMHEMIQGFSFFEFTVINSDISSKILLSLEIQSFLLIQSLPSPDSISSRSTYICSG